MKLKMLVADDNAGVRDAFAEFLTRDFPNLEVHTAGSFAEAKRLLDEHHGRKEPFHFVLTDTDMERKTAGFEVLAHAKRLNPATSVVGMSGYLAVGSEYRRLGAEGFLLKPIGIDELNAALRKHGFEKHGIREE